MQKWNKTKEFDCVEMKRRLQEQLYEATKGMTPEEYLAYIHQCIANSQFASFLEPEMDACAAEPPVRK